MYCQRRITHTIEAGDSLYKLAKQYDTTVTELILGNPGANPYNLLIGAKLQICPGQSYLAKMESNGSIIQQVPSQGNGTMQNGTMQNGAMQDIAVPDGTIPDGTMQNAVLPNGMMPANGTMQNGMMQNGMMPENGTDKNMQQKGDAIQKVLEEMRLAWLSQIYWVRMYLMSVAAQAGDQQEVEERMMETPDEITDVFADFLPVGVTRELRTLLMQQTERFGEAIRNISSGLPYDFEAWQSDAEMISELLERHSAYFGNNSLRNQLLNYQDLTHREIEEQMSGMYGKSIDTFRDLETQVLEMADFLSKGMFVR